MQKIKSFIFNILFLVVCGLIGYFISAYFFVIISVEGISMQPTVDDSDKAFVLKSDKLKFGDVFIFDSAELELRLIKRVIGVEGDEIEVKKEGKQSYLYRNGEKLDESYINEPMTYVMSKVIVPKGKIFFLGDNRNISQDSHENAGLFCDTDTIVGKVLFLFKNGKLKIKSVNELDFLPSYVI